MKVVFSTSEVIVINEKSSRTIIQPKHNKSIRLLQKLVAFKFYLIYMFYRNECIIDSPLKHNKRYNNDFFHDRSTFIINIRTFF